MFNFKKDLIVCIVIFLAWDCLLAMETGQEKKKVKIHPNCYEAQKNRVQNVFCVCITEQKKVCNENLKKMTIAGALRHLFSHVSKKMIMDGKIKKVIYACPIPGCFVNTCNSAYQMYDHLVDELKNCGVLKRLSEIAREKLIDTVMQNVEISLVAEDLSTLGDKSSGNDVHLFLDWEKE